MLTNLLESLTAMHHPPLCELFFLVVENDHIPASRMLVDDVRSQFRGSTLHYLLEDRIGIPFARNRAIKYAVEIGADLLAFVDDDEVVDKVWLEELIHAFRKSNALLLGGPVLAGSPPKNASLRERFIHSAISKRYLKKAKRAHSLAAIGKDLRVTITTGNWLGSTELFVRHGLLFNEKMRFSGGSDAEFFAQVRHRRLQVRWVSGAIVRETVPLERLSSSYQFRRAFDQSTTSFRRKLEKSKANAFSLILTVPLRALGVAILFAAVVPSGGATYLSALRGAGWIAGRLAAVGGRQSNLYRRTTGS